MRRHGCLKPAGSKPCEDWTRAVVSGAARGDALPGRRGDRGDALWGRRSGYFAWYCRPNLGSSSGRILGLTANRSCRFSAPGRLAEAGRWTGRAVGLADPGR